MIGLAFFVCDIGEQMCSAFGEMECEISQFDWYLFPSEVITMFPSIIMHSQQPFQLNGYGSYSYCRQVFAKVSLYNKRLNSEFNIYISTLLLDDPRNILKLYGTSSVCSRMNWSFFCIST